MILADGTTCHRGQRVSVLYGVFAGATGEVFYFNENSRNILVTVDGRKGRPLGFLRTELTREGEMQCAIT